MCRKKCRKKFGFLRKNVILVQYKPACSGVATSIRHGMTANKKIPHFRAGFPFQKSVRSVHIPEELVPQLPELYLRSLGVPEAEDKVHFEVVLIIHSLKAALGNELAKRIVGFLPFALGKVFAVLRKILANAVEALALGGEVTDSLHLKGVFLSSVEFFLNYANFFHLFLWLSF